MSNKLIAASIEVLLILSIGVVVGWWVTSDYYQDKANKLALENSQKIIAEQERVREVEQQLIEYSAQIDQQFLKDKMELENETNKRIDAIRRGSVRVSVPVKNCGSTGEAGTGTGGSGAETRAELSDESFKFLIGEARHADEITLQLGACQDILQHDRDSQ